MSRCIKLDDCPKVKMVLDKDLASDWQYAEAIQSVCAECQEKEMKISAKDTVMKITEKNRRKTLQGKLLEQAEITWDKAFKAGIREVINSFDEVKIHSNPDTRRRKFVKILNGWQEFLRSEGIE